MVPANPARPPPGPGPAPVPSNSAPDFVHPQLKYLYGKKDEWHWSEYPTSVQESAALEQEEPYKPVLHRWEALRKYRDTVEDDERREDASLFINFFDVAMADSGKIIAKLHKTGTIACDKLDLVFSLGEVVIMQAGGVTSAHYLRSFQKEGGYWLARLDSIDWNGRFLGSDRCRRISGSIGRGAYRVP